jgi:putative ABC transport system permease protein
MEHDGKNISCQLLVGDTAVFEMLGLQKIRENNLASFERTGNYWDNLGNVYPNQQAMKEMELSEDAPRFISWSIAGIIRDFQISNITHAQVPVLFFYYTPELLQHYSPWSILVEIQGDPLSAYKQIQPIYERITKVDFEGKFIDKQVEESFAAQIQVSRIIILFSIIAVLIALLGLLAMSTYFIRQRTAEIAIRKVHGADSFEVLSKLVRTFLAYVLIAFVIAVPVAWYIMRNWLDDYSYRIRLSPLIFIAGGGFCFLIAFIAVYWQSRIAANANPVKSLKSE